MLFFPGGEWAEMRKMPGDPPDYRDEYELFWIDAPTPDKQGARLKVEGHTPRSYPTLYVQYLPETSALVFSSSQGISRVSVPDGAVLDFWELQDRRSSLQPYAWKPPAGEGLVVVAEGDGLYYIRP